MIRRGKRKGQHIASIRPEVRSQLDLLGRERALIYKTFVLTALRKGELASLTVAQVDLDADVPHIVLIARLLEPLPHPTGLPQRQAHQLRPGTTVNSPRLTRCNDSIRILSLADIRSSLIRLVYPSHGGDTSI
ncbi:MAG: hypothetical protein NTU53_06425 [Planctomycetota bacterium]|nr:hypothetical protein [Planctomycetota bacterium]